MTESSRVQRWREGKRQHGLKAVTIWLTTEEELRLKDIALQWHCSPSVVMQRALAQLTTSSPPQNSSPPDTLPIRELIKAELATLHPELSMLQVEVTTIQEELAAMQAKQPPVTETVTETITATLARDLPALVRQLVEGLALEALGLPVTDIGNGGVADMDDDTTDTYGNATDIEAPGEATPGQEEAPRRSTRRGGLKLTPEQEVALRAKRQQGIPIKALMEEYGISKASVFRYLQ
jgi:hypothetical protein